MIVITGASDGLGAALAKKINEKGKKVICLSRTKPKSSDILWLKTDFQDDALVEKTVNILINMDEKIEAVINSAAITSYEKNDSLSPGELSKMFKTNITGPMLLTSGLLAKIKEDEGDIVNIGATIALKSGGPEQAVYSTTKWALRGYTENLQNELRETKCRVVNFLVGGFRTRMHEKVTSVPLAQPDDWMPVEDVADCLISVLEMPKTMEISEIIVNRKTNI